MNTTLDYLEQEIQIRTPKNKIRHFFREMKVFIIMFVVSFVWMLLFTNAELFFWWSNDTQIVNWNQKTAQADNSISSSVHSYTDKKEELEDLLKLYANDETIEKTTTISTEQDLENKLSDYDFDFNMLPPTDRLIISKINLDVPLINSKYKNEVDFTQWNFNEELESGVVKYPTTPEPWAEWNTLIFGHTSQEWWQKNPYWTVFSKIPNLQEWDTITVIWKWKMYEYKVVEKIIVTPANVDKQYQKYQNQEKDYITLMWCYPLWRTDKRMMIIAVRVK